MKSWKTTFCGIGAFLIALITALTAMWDGDAGTEPQWAIVVTALIAAVGLFMARDNDKSSEDVGAQK
ncbi:MAG TPA: hypothetical protein VMY37_25225 [Thermoguttaceae bacterium]|nr:hypothetical protein [Thermoguttaceae bacterium]HUX02496.1 hypothetical protein [Phycisphaerae bacterium]